MATVRIESESMTLTTYLIESGVSAASNSGLISLNNASGTSGMASTSFTGTSGTYDIFLGYFDENDGQATLEVQLGNNPSSILRLDQNLGSGGVNSKTLQRKQIASGRSLSNGELIKIIGTANQSEWARVDYIEFVDSPPPTGTPIRVEAESMVLSTYRRETGGGFASGGAYASLIGGTRTETGSASYTFTGTSGIYDVVLGYYDEKDGSTNLKVHKGTTLLANLSLKQNRGSSGANAQTLVPRRIGRLEIKNGETIKITGTENSGEPARVDYLEFIPVKLRTINGTNSNNILIDRAGKTKLVGGNGSDTASYSQAARGVVANLSTGAVFTALSGAPNAPLKIMPLGDSITYGVVNTNAGDRESGGYRTYLHNAFIRDGLSVDFVGSVNSGSNSLADKDHEGHPGYTIPKIASGINAWLDAYKPDVIPLMIGTNDTRIVSASSIAARLSALIDQITAKLPNSQLLVSTITPVDGTLKGSTRAQRAADYNLAIPGVVKSKVSQSKKVSFVDMRSELDLSDLAEGLHPNQGGYQDITNFWYNAITDTSLDKDSLNSIENLVGSGYNDKLLGNVARNVLEGGAGSDRLTGGWGADAFVYRRPNEGADLIADFTTDDSFLISAAGFGGGLRAGTALSTTNSATGVLVSGSNPTPIGTSANFLYNTATGLLGFDGDGTGALARATIATLTGPPALTASRFTITA